MKKTVLSLLSLVAMGAMAQTVVGDADLANAYANKTYDKRVVCHDPSIVMDNISNPAKPKYYIYGSHLGRAWTYASSNYQNWTTNWGSDESNKGTSNSLFAYVDGKLVNYKDAYDATLVSKVKNYKGEMVDFGSYDKAKGVNLFSAHDWQYKGNTVAGMEWAPDIIYNKTMKKWCLYMSLNGDNFCSTIVCFVSKTDSPEGPWIYQGPVVFSGFSGRYDHNGFSKDEDWKHTDLAIATGCTSLPERYSTDRWTPFGPNCIDPCVFYDDDDNLWMSYGSWFAGIFMIRLDKENGLRDYTYTFPYEINGVAAQEGAADANATSDPYFGRKIAGGWGVSGEASYIQKVGKYYYLFMSYGGLVSNGGYQIRVFRSEKPDGPYVDCLTKTGINAVYNKGRINFGADANRDEGVKLFGNYQWDTMPTAELAQGHNSAMIDEKGRTMLVYHTRFNDGTEGHQVRVHQLFLNQDGWLVAAPYEFSGETYTDNDIASHQLYSADEVEGDYQLIAHPYRQNTAAKAYEKPVTIHLNADGTVTGEYTGKWELVSGTSYINLTLKGAATANMEVTFKGVLTEQTIDYTNIKSLCFTALSSSDGMATSGGASLQTRGLSVWGSKADAKAAIKYTLDKVSVPFSDGATLNASPKLPTEGKLGTAISWKSSDTSVLTDEGVVKGKGKVILTMTIAKDGYEYVKDYTLNIDADAAETTPVYYPVSAEKNVTNAFFSNFTDYYYLEAGKAAEFKFYNYSNGAKNWENWVLAVTTDADRWADGYEEYLILRNDNYGWGTMYANNCVLQSDFDWDVFCDDMNGSLVDMNVSYAKDAKFVMTSTITAKNGHVYHYSADMTITTKPTKIRLFFTGEKSYIDGSSLSTGISTPVIVNEQGAAKWYNLAGQQVDKGYKGVVVVNGKKFVNK